MTSITRADLVRVAVTAIIMLPLLAPAAAQNRSLLPAPTPMLPPPPQFPPPATMLPPLPAPMLPPPPATSMTIPRPAEIGAPPVLAVPDAEARQTERVCIEKEMCVDVPVMPRTPGASERK